MKSLIVLLALLLAGITAMAQQLEKLWATPVSLKTPESVLYSPEHQLAFVSCMGEELNTKTGDGYLAQINLKGEIVNPSWLAGLNDPKGMAIHKGKIYVADMNELVIIDLETASIEQKFLIPEAKFLNDVAVCKNGQVFVSDSRDQRIYSYQNDTFDSWLHDPKLENVNGLWTEGGKLYAGNQSVWEINIENKELKQLFDGAGGVDGLEIIEPHRFVFSNWGGKIYVSDKGKVIQLLDTTAEEINTADIDYVPSGKLVLVPTFFKNNVVAYRLNW